MKTRSYHQPILLIGCIVVAFAYWTGLSGPFLLDDFSNIPFKLLDSPTWAQVVSVLTTNDSGPSGRPLSVLSFFIHGALGAEGPFQFKLFNLALHLMNGWLLYFLVTRCLQHRGVALAIALIWLAHPLLVSTVLYTVQRMTLLSAFFMLLSLNCYTVTRVRLGQSYKAAMLHYGGTFIFAVLAIMSKENALVLPALLGLLEGLYYTNQPGARRRALFFWGVFALILSSGFFAWSIWEADYAIRGWTPWERLTTQVYVLGYYLHLIATPMADNLSLYHDDFPLYESLDILGVLLLIAYGASIALAWRLRRLAPWFALGVGWFFINHIIESTLVPLELVFEHRNYLASLGPILLFVVMVSYLGPVLALGFPLAALIYCVNLTHERATVWSSLTSFTEHTLETKADSFRVHVDAAQVLSNQGSTQAALEHLFVAQTLVPHNPGPSIHAVVIACRTGEIKEDVVEQAAAAIQRGRDFRYALQAFEQLGYVLATQPCSGLSQGYYISLIQQVLDNDYLALRPEYRAAFFYMQAMSFALQHNYSEAKRRLEMSFESNPADPYPLIEKANIYSHEGDLKAVLETAQRLKAYPAWRYPLINARLEKIVAATRNQGADD